MSLEIHETYKIGFAYFGAQSGCGRKAVQGAAAILEC
jgi:hypothetical protein